MISNPIFHFAWVALECMHTDILLHQAYTYTNPPYPLAANMQLHTRSIPSLSFLLPICINLVHNASLP